MGLGRLELPTSRLSGVRSNHLSYRPVGLRRRREAALASSGVYSRVRFEAESVPVKPDRDRRSDPPMDAERPVMILRTGLRETLLLERR